MMQPTFLTTEMCVHKHWEKRTEDAVFAHLSGIDELLPFHKPKYCNLELTPI